MFSEIKFSLKLLHSNILRKMKISFAFCLLATWLSHLDANQLGTRIVGGNNAFAGQFPFTAAIYTTTAEGRYFCGGTLISNQWIVTAGQCVDGALLFEIHLGSTSLSKDDSNRETLATSEYVLHPGFNPSTLVDDIGLIRLRLPVQLSNYIYPIHSLPANDLEASTRVVVLGWGQTNDQDAGLSDDLQYVAVSALSNEECRLTYGGQITDNMICVEGNYNEGACHGDTGTPLVLVVIQGNSQLVGVSSFLSGNGCESTDPSGYTRVYPYVQWIVNVTNADLTIS